jgi:hypothetical protein
MERRIAAWLAAAGIALACVGSWPRLAPADDNGALIWAPSKTGSNAYKLRAGLRLPGNWEPSAGAELSVRATPGGKIHRPAAPIRLWGLLSRKSGRQASAQSAQVSMDFNALNGAGSVGLGTARSWIVTPTLDAEVQQNIVLQCDAQEGNCERPRLTQSARLTSPATRTSIVAQGRFSGDSISGLSRIGVEQKFGNLRLGAAVSEPLLAPRSIFDLRYSFEW